MALATSGRVTKIVTLYGVDANVYQTINSDSNILTRNVYADYRNSLSNSNIDHDVYANAAIETAIIYYNEGAAGPVTTYQTVNSDSKILVRNNYQTINSSSWVKQGQVYQTVNSDSKIKVRDNYQTVNSDSKIKVRDNYQTINSDSKIKKRDNYQTVNSDSKLS